MRGALFRPRLALLNGVTAVGGYLLFPGEIDSVRLGALFAGVVLLAAAGSALNQVLERDIDRLMERTRLRPLPAGKLTLTGATVAGCTLLLAGSLVLVLAGRWLPALLGGAALAWYLVLYTPLKRRTSLALAAGAVCGAIPPVIGWCSAGGSPVDYPVVLLAGLLYLWQIPHFWFLQLRHADDYRRAGIPLLRLRSGDSFPAGICRLWLAALVAGTLLLPAFGVIGNPGTVWFPLLPLALGIVSLVRSETVIFSSLNLFPLLLTLLLFSR
ncbi:protoheme IX farnesyltransferase [Geomobilimonas luticola]|uniref:Protoheme IX farnesyltransferase n=1 Tax=Geomobilimonas luticola TaxID=1114878 RepID=A0ABS5S982_9BACT|nr:protoheme IX farnesyltransferase [Geomobilimonas luticola]MBT0651922.1 protoheme IX farnesyltransferase [Geomobilimonas luticola]